MSDVSIEVINATGIDAGTITLIKSGQPFVYWLNLYRELGLSITHAEKVIRKLTPGTHYIKLTREEIRPLLDSIPGAGIPNIPAVRSYYFLSPEGWNRAILEIETDSMINRAAAASLEETKNKIAKVFTRYQRGEVLSKAADEIPALTGDVFSVEDELTASEKRIKLYNTARKVAISLGADRRATNKVMVEKIKGECPEVYPFMAMVPDGEPDDPPEDAVITRQEASKHLGVKLQDLEDRIVRIGWAVRAPYGWSLTRKGMKYLKQDPHIGGKKLWYDIRFGLDALHMLKAEFEQRLLTGGYLSGGTSRGRIPVTGAE
jgi:hypothetical protein